MTAVEPLPLEGVRVVDLTRYVSGPFCTMILADAGAEVIKVEPPDGEVTRTLEPLIDGPDRHQLSGYFLRYNRHKRSICVDLTVPAGRQILAELLRTSDVLVENFRPDVLDRLGFGEADLASINPRLVYCSISGYGHSPGPFRDWPAYHMTAEAMAGAVARTAEDGTPPLPLGLIVGDIFPATLAATGILLALQRRNMTGTGGRVDIAMYDSMMVMNELNIGKAALAGESMPIGGRSHPFYAPWGVFPVRDGYVVLNVSSDQQWLGLCRAILAPELLRQARLRRAEDRVRYMDEVIRPVLDPWLRQHTRAEAVDALVAEGVPAAPVRDSWEVLQCPQARLRGMISRVEIQGGGATEVVGNPVMIRPLNGPLPVDGRIPRAPVAGSDTRDILHELGLDEHEIEFLLDMGAVQGNGP